MGRPPKNTTRPLITADEAGVIARDLEQLKEMGGAGEMSESGYTPTAQIDDICIDKDAIRRKIRVLENQLESHKSQKIADPVKRRELEARRKWLESQFKDCIESYRDLGVIRRDDPNWAPAYKKAIERPKYEHFISEWKRIGLMLEPEDPSINNLDQFRS